MIFNSLMVGNSGGSTPATRKVRFSYYTVDDYMPAEDMSYLVCKDRGLYLMDASFEPAADGKEITLSEGELLVVRCASIAGMGSFFCSASGGYFGTLVDGYYHLVVDPANGEDILIQSEYNP